MSKDGNDWRSILSQVEKKPHQRSFFKQLHRKISKAYKRLCGEAFIPLLDEALFFSQQIDRAGVQDSSLFRNRKMSLALAKCLVDEKGLLRLEQLQALRHFLQKHLHCLGSDCLRDDLWRLQIYQVLQSLEEPLVLQKLESFQLVAGDERVQALIRDTLELEETETLHKGHVRQAVLCACFAYLRQNVGSCFATAPAILVQTEKMSLFLGDLLELLSCSVLKRTYGGVEYSAPLSPSWGVADLKRPFILRDETPLEKTPGFFQALASSGLLSEASPKKEAFEHLRGRLQKSFPELPPLGKLMTAKELFQQLLADHLEVKEEDLSSDRPLAANQRGVNRKLKAFQQALAQAEKTFKQSSDNALLKVWEFTLASFAETKAVFSRWNFYASLGLAPDDPGGIGACIYQELEILLQEANEKAAQMQEPYEQSYRQLQYLELKMERAASEQDARYLRGEYQLLVGEMNACMEERDRYQKKAQRIAHLFDQIIDCYDALFQEYFQEVYDADLHEVTKDLYDDSPAGFRLLYKHGRAYSHLWTQITNPEEFSAALRDFFLMTEHLILRTAAFEGLEEEFSQIITKVVQHVGREEFLESSLMRMARVHGGTLPAKPLENLSLVDKKPWVYTSGGTMNHLVSCYFCRENLPFAESKWVESPLELLAFFIDVMKGLPNSESQVFLNDPQKSLLCHSPTHAFLFKPGLFPFCQAWQDPRYTYSWIRDEYVLPGQSFVKSLDLCELKQHYLITECSKMLLEPFRDHFEKNVQASSQWKSIDDFRLALILSTEAKPSLQFQNRDLINREEIDSVLFANLPLFLGHEIFGLVEKVLYRMFDKEVLDEAFLHKALEIAKDLSHSFVRGDVFSSKHFQELLRGIFILVLEKPFSEKNLSLEALEASRELGFALPAPLIFADSNWNRDFFAFVLNPGNLELEFWRVNHLGSSGSVMKSWKHWLDGSHSKPTWGVYPHKKEYGA